MSVLIKDMEMPKECHGCRWFYFQGTSCTEPKYYLDARCELVESGQDWYGKDRRGGWVGESIEHIPGWTGSYAYKHCTEVGTRAKQCPLCELPSAQPEKRTEKRTETHACDLIRRQAAIDALDKRFDSIPMEQTTEILQLRKDLRELPSAQPEHQWIPCSERLPEKNCRCLTTNEALGSFEVDWNAWIDGQWLYPNDKPIAWMPLPEPYKEDDDEAD